MLYVCGNAGSLRESRGHRGSLMGMVRDEIVKPPASRQCYGNVFCTIGVIVGACCTWCFRFVHREFEVAIRDGSASCSL